MSVLEKCLVYNRPLVSICSASLVAQLVKSPPAMQVTQVQSLVCEDHQEKEMTTHSNSLAWKILTWTDVEAETPTLWPTDVQNWLIGKDPDAGKD